jgi:L-2-hydroxyglutarate oxidase
VLEAEPDVAEHQSGRNSGVIHSGLYYAPGSAKAELCVAGRLLMADFCATEGVPRLECGKLVVAMDDSEFPALAELERRGTLNGLKGLETLDGRAVIEREPRIRAARGLWVPETSVTDFRAVALAMARRLRLAGAGVHMGTRVTALRSGSGDVSMSTTAGTFRSATAVFCGGLSADRLARMGGLEAGVSIIPFRGTYATLHPRWSGAVSCLVYPVPDPRFPFLGVHLTPTIDGRLLAGPTALPAFARDARRLFDGRDALDAVASRGWRRLARREWRFALAEMRRATSRRALCRALGALLPGVTPADLASAPAGVRAQAATEDGRLVDDFLTITHERAIHVLNAPSPAATASLALGRCLADRARALLDS